MVYVELSAVANSIEESGYIPDRWNEDVCIHKYQLIILMWKTKVKRGLTQIHLWFGTMVKGWAAHIYIITVLASYAGMNTILSQWVIFGL